MTVVGGVWAAAAEPDGTLRGMQPIINDVVQWATHLIGAWGLPAVFFLMLLESACIPVPSEAIMPFAGFAVSEGTLTFLGIVVAGVAGNLVGSWIAYAVGYYGGQPFVDRWGKYVLLRPHHLATAQHWFDKYGCLLYTSDAADDLLCVDL